MVEAASDPAAAFAAVFHGETAFSRADFAIARTPVRPNATGSPVFCGLCAAGVFRRQPTTGILNLCSATFPSRTVYLNLLDFACEPITDDPRRAHSHIIFTPKGISSMSKRLQASTQAFSAPRLQPPPPNGLIILSKPEPARHMEVYTLAQHEVGRSFLVGLHGEPYAAWAGGADAVFVTTADTSDRYITRDAAAIFWPVISRAMYLGMYGNVNASSISQRLRVPAAFNASFEARRKGRFCAFRYSSCDKDFYGNSLGLAAPLRVALFDALSEQYKRPDSHGTCRPDDEIARRYGNRFKAVRADSNRFAEHNTLRPYKFVFAAENSLASGYFTEMLLNAVLAHAVPIVLGKGRWPPILRRQVNMKRILYCPFPSDDDTLEVPFNASDPEARILLVKRLWPAHIRRCVEKIAKVDQDDELFERTIATPLLPNNDATGTVFDLATVADALRTTLRHHNSHLLS
jgi:hypothetical protein